MLASSGTAEGEAELILVVYTTLYRKGGAMIARAAETLASERRRAGEEVMLRAVESKGAFVQACRDASAVGDGIRELHFLGHAGMYGPMFRTTAMPEQLSPHEWRRLRAGGVIRFAVNATAHFHACRTARWFAPFFARTFGVPTYGFHWYTTVSKRPERFEWIASRGYDGPVYLLGCPGKKSHGLWGSLGKYTGLVPAETMKRFEPEDIGAAGSYDGVAELYDAVFEDIRVRRDEWRFLSRRLPEGKPRVLDIGCGNGALLCQLADAIGESVGIDPSEGMLACARRRAAEHSHLRFEKVNGPHLPLADNSVDVVISMLSFRYLDWDPLMMEIMRVLAPGGRLLIVDMVTAPLKLRELRLFARSKALAWTQRASQERFRQNLASLVKDPRWKTMVHYNPIRAEHEMKWFLESRFPGRQVEVLNIGWHNRVLGFDSGPIDKGTWVAPQSYP